jgi:predicted dehydrogenase
LGESIAGRYSVSSWHTEYDAALEECPDIVVICTPAPWHVPMARRAVEAGASVLIEKPLSTSMEGVDSLIDLVKRSGKVASVAYVYRCHPGLRAMRQAIQTGQFGEPLSLVANSGQHFPTYRPAYRDIYYNDRRAGGGAVQDALTHVVNASEWLVGPAQRVLADYGHQALEGVSVEDTAHVLTRHGRVMGCYSLNQFQAPNESTITVVCTKGTARFEYHRNRWRWMTDPLGQWHDEVGGPLERDTLFTLQANSFLDAVEGRGPLGCTLEEARQTLRVNLAILRSGDPEQQDGRWVEI